MMGDPRNVTHMVNVERFISDVFSRPAIWHRSYALNKAFLEDTWDELAEIHNLPKKTLKCKWKGLRDNFRVEFKRIPRDELTGELLISPEEYDSKWANYKPLLFLAEHLRSRTGNRELDGVCVKGDSLDFEDSSADKELLAFCEEKAQQIVKPQITIRPIENLSNSAIAPRLKPVIDAPPPVKRSKLDGEHPAPEPSSALGNIDDDYHFLMSLHPYMVDLNASQKLRVRMKIQKVIFKELYKDEDDLDDSVAK